MSPLIYAAALNYRIGKGPRLPRVLEAARTYTEDVMTIKKASA